MQKRHVGLEKTNNYMELKRLRPTWAEIDLDSLTFNIDLIQKNVGNSKIFPVVKADAYGHGAVHVCKALEKKGVDYLCLALLEEGIELRRADIDLPILMLGPLETYQIEEAIHNRFTLSAYRMDIIDEIEKVASKIKRSVPFHLKLDTGMGRLGFLPDQADAVASRIKKLRYSYVEGIFSNFSSADEPFRPATMIQVKRFVHCISTFGRYGIMIKIPHLANSSGILNFPDSHQKAVRPGLLIYGINPPSSPKRLNVKPVLSLKSRIVSLKEFGTKAPIGYSERFITKRKSLIAVLPIGYDDGLTRALVPGGEIILKGQRAPIVGAVSMDLITVDVTGIHGAKIGDVTTLIGKDSSEEISVLEMAQKAGTIPYEILCGIGKRVPRVYIQNGLITSMKSFHM